MYISHEEYLNSVSTWQETIPHYTLIKNLITLHSVFRISTEQVAEINKQDEYPADFRLDAGVYKNSLIIVFVPGDAEGAVKIKEQYLFSPLENLESDIQLKEIQQYTVVNRSLLSKDLSSTSKISAIDFPILSQPVTGQQVAVGEIQEWRNSGYEWFYRECTEFKSERIFNRFFIAKENLLNDQDYTTYIICSFALKFSDIYQRMLVTLIFISFQKNIFGHGEDRDVSISNIYNYSRPCPSVCHD